MSLSTVDEGTGTTLNNMKVVIYNNDTQDMQMYDGDNILLKGDTVFVSQQGSEYKQMSKVINMKKIMGQGTCFMSVTGAGVRAGCDGGAKKRKRKMIKASELGPEFMALMTMNAEIDNRLLQHATRSFKRKHAIDADTYIDYDYLDVIGTEEAEADGIDGGAKKRKRKTSVKRRKNKKATKKAFNMDVDEYEEMQEDVILDKDVDALGDITIDRLAFNDNCSLSGAGNIFDQLGAAISTQRAVIQGGGDRMIAQCECDADQMYQNLVNKGAMMHRQRHCAEPQKAEIQKAETQSNTCQNGGCDCNNNAPTTNENTIDDIVKAVVNENTNTANAEVDGGKKKHATKKHTSKKRTNKKAEDYLSSSEDTSDGTSEGTSEGTSSESISDADTSDLSEISADDNIAQADETTGTTVMYF